MVRVDACLQLYGRIQTKVIAGTLRVVTESMGYALVEPERQIMIGSQELVTHQKFATWRRYFCALSLSFVRTGVQLAHRYFLAEPSAQVNCRAHAVFHPTPTGGFS